MPERFAYTFVSYKEIHPLILILILASIQMIPSVSRADRRLYNLTHLFFLIHTDAINNNMQEIKIQVPQNFSNNLNSGH